MNSLPCSRPLCRQWAGAFCTSIWQAAVIGVVYALIRSVLPRGNPRYLAPMLALMAMAVCPIATGVRELSLAAMPELADATMAATPVVDAASRSAMTTPSWRLLLTATLPWLVLAWAVLGARVYRQ